MGDAPATRRPHAPAVAGSSGANSVVFPYCCRMSMTQAFNIALILVGDELLSGRRRDAHLPHFAGVFAARGLHLRQVWVVGDGREDIARVLGDSRRLHCPVLCCGGIGATPDDQTRQAAAEAFGSPLEIHEAGRHLLESLYRERTYPHRIRMVEFPQGAELIPNPVNQVPGFSLDRHHFLPGFPEMAWPMAEWVLERVFGEVDTAAALVTCRLGFRGVPESDLIPLLDAVGVSHPKVKLSCLPNMRDGFPVEVGATGRSIDARAAIDDFHAGALGAGLAPHTLEAEAQDAEA